MKNFFIIYCLFIAIGGTLVAQEKEATSVEVSLYAFDYAKGYQTIFLVDNKNQVNEIKLSKANIQGSFKTVLDKKLNITLRTQARNDEGAIFYPAICKVKIPSHIKQPLVILFPGVENQVYKAIVMDRSVSNFPKGSYKLINVSSSAIRGFVGNTKIIAPSKKITPFNPSNNREKILDVHFQYRRTSDWKTFGRTRWVNEKEKRSLLCAYLDPRTKRMKIRGIIVKSNPLLIPPNNKSIRE